MVVGALNLYFIRPSEGEKKENMYEAKGKAHMEPAGCHVTYFFLNFIFSHLLETCATVTRCFISVSPGMVTMATGSEQQVSPEERKYHSSH